MRKPTRPEFGEASVFFVKRKSWESATSAGDFELGDHSRVAAAERGAKEVGEIHASASQGGCSGCQVRLSRSRALTRVSSLRMTATRATLRSLPLAVRRS